MSPVMIAVVGGVGVLLFDAIAAVIARTGLVAYTWFAPGSLIAYGLAGYFAAGAASGGPVVVGAAAGAAAAASESTIGWRIARALGVDDVSRVSERDEAAAAAMVTCTGAILGAVGGLLS